MQELGKASIHFLRGNCPEAFASAVVDCMSKVSKRFFFEKGAHLDLPYCTGSCCGGRVYFANDFLI